MLRLVALEEKLFQCNEHNLRCSCKQWAAGSVPSCPRRWESPEPFSSPECTPDLAATLRLAIAFLSTSWLLFSLCLFFSSLLSFFFFPFVSLALSPFLLCHNQTKLDTREQLLAL